MENHTAKNSANSPTAQSRPRKTVENAEKLARALKRNLQRRKEVRKPASEAEA